MKNSTAPARTAPAAPPWSVIVFGHNLVVLDHPGAGHKVIPHVPAGVLDDVGLLLDECAQRFVQQGHGTVIVPHAPLPNGGAMLDGITHEVQLRQVIENAAAAGWTTTPAALKHASGWVTFYKRPCAIVHLGILNGMDADKQPLFPVDGGDYTAGDIAAQLARYHELTGVPYRINPGVSGLAMIRQYYQGRPAPRGLSKPPLPSWRWHGKVPEIHTPDDMIWERTPTKAEIAAGPFVHGYDVNLAHLAAASAVSLGWEQPDATGAIAFDPARPGVWRIEMPPPQQWGKLFPPIVNPGRVARDGTGWISTPGAVFLRQLGHGIVVHDSWTSPAIDGASRHNGDPVYGRQILRPFAERLRDALAMTAAPIGHPDPCGCPRCRLRATLKETYTAAFGMMLTESSGIYRPDWVWSFHDLNRYNVTRKILSVPSRPPIRVNKDAVYYLDATRDPRQLGEELGYKPGAMGKFKIDYSGTYTAWKAEQDAARRKLRAQRGLDVKGA